MGIVRLAVLVSGGGTNLQAIIDRIELGELDAEIAVVISSRRTAFALERARQHGLPAVCLRPKDFAAETEYAEALLACLNGNRVDLIILAGYMSVLDGRIIAAYRNRIMNIHPALIPAFCGAGMYGERVHSTALAYGVKVSGCTVMFVDEGVDTGPIILQTAVPVLDSDTVETLGARVLEQEHSLYSRAIQLYAEGRLRLDGRRVTILPAKPNSSNQNTEERGDEE